jgi:predicted P-loop ATPase
MKSRIETLSALNERASIPPADPFLDPTGLFSASPVTAADSASKEPATLVNLAMALTCGHLGSIRWDDFLGAAVIETRGTPAIVGETVLTRLAIHCELKGLTNVRLSLLKSVVLTIAKANRFDSAKEWLDRLPVWDGVGRVERFLPDYLGTRDSPYERAIGRYWWTAMISRILEPGHKVDMVPILVGKQGVGKTRLLESVPPTLEHYGDVRLTDHASELARRVMGKILMGWEELRGIRGRVDADEVKTFITNRYVELRSSTKAGMDQHLRRFVIIGTSNRKDFLRDATGHRRYLPFDVHSIDLESFLAVKEQLWAEALHLVQERRESGRSLVDNEEAERLAEAEHHAYINQARWVDDDDLLAWLKHDNVRFRTEDALRIVGVHMPTRNDRSEMRKTLEQLGLQFRSTYDRSQPHRPKTWQWPPVRSGTGMMQSGRSVVTRRTLEHQPQGYTEGYGKRADFCGSKGVVPPR